MPGSPPGFFVLVGVHGEADLHTERAKVSLRVQKTALVHTEFALFGQQKQPLMRFCCCFCRLSVSFLLKRISIHYFVKR